MILVKVFWLLCNMNVIYYSLPDWWSFNLIFLYETFQKIFIRRDLFLNLCIVGALFSMLFCTSRQCSSYKFLVIMFTSKQRFNRCLLHELQEKKACFLALQV